jgi:hypothetical protein
MKIRVVRLEDGYWRIRSAKRDIGADEQRRLIEYFAEIRLPCKIIGGRIRVPDSVPWSDISERLEHFYDGNADVLPF